MDKEQTNFLRTLTEDVQQALDRTVQPGTPSDRRNLLRAIIAAAEGLSWVYRTHVLSMAKEIDSTTPLIELAFSEISFFVSENGEIIKQARYFSTTAMIRLTTRVAKEICPKLEVDFGTRGWQNLKDAIRMRNRITHPKSSDDLIISDQDVETAKAGFFWLLATTVHVMEKTLEEFAIHAAIGMQLIEDLKKGDPAALELYQQTYNALDS